MPECCSKYKDAVFVFGSNLAGIHGKGAALHARKFHGSWQHNNGLMGDISKGVKCYGVPTRDEKLNTLALRTIWGHVSRFLKCAKDLSGYTSYVTRIGCGLAGYRSKDIAPMFKRAPKNCILPKGWRESAL